MAAVVGGTASVMADGKFANGAETAASAHMFNRFAHSAGQVGRSAVEGRVGRETTEIPELAAGAYTVIADSLTVSIGPVGLEMGEAWLLDSASNEVLHLKLKAIERGVGIGTWVSRQFEFVSIESSADLLGYSVALRIDGTPGIGGAASFSSGIVSFSPGASGRIAVGVYAGIGLPRANTSFVGGYSRADSFLVCSPW